MVSLEVIVNETRISFLELLLITSNTARIQLRKRMLEAHAYFNTTRALGKRFVNRNTCGLSLILGM